MQIQFFHISDIHCGYNNYTVENLRETMPVKIRDFTKTKGQIIRYIFITGDLKYGKENPKEYPEGTLDFIKSLQSELGVNPENTYIVPGNHDVTRYFTRDAAIDLIKKQYSSSQGTIKNEYLDELSQTTSEFRKIYQDICGREYKDNHFYIDLGFFNLIHLNSALICGKDNEDGSLIIGMSLLKNALKGMDTKKPAIVLAHHSFDCFTNPEQLELEKFLKSKNAVLYLCGHKHVALFSDISVKDKRKPLWQFLCGTNMDKDPGLDSTNMDVFVGMLDTDDCSGYIDAYKWNKSDWMPDSDFSYSENETTDGRVYFPPQSITNRYNYKEDEKHEESNVQKNNNKNLEIKKNEDECIGYCINFGMNSCRRYEVRKGNPIYLKEMEPIAYGVTLYDSDATSNISQKPSIKKKKEFLEEITRISTKSLQTIMKSGRFVRVFADPEYKDIFSGKDDIDKFIEDYYKQTGYYFSILTQEQTEANMKALFPDIKEKTAIIDICSSCVYVVLKRKKSFKSHQIKISTIDIREKGGDRDWDDVTIKEIKDEIKKKIGKTLWRQKADSAYIIKDECTFMEKLGYPLIQDGNNKHISFDDYSAFNKETLYSDSTFKNTIDNAFFDLEENIRKKYYGFKEGHIILETIFEMLEVEDIIPKNHSNFLRSPFAYVFNVVLSGSIKPQHIEYMQIANDYFSNYLAVNVTSPSSTALGKKTKDTYQRHMKMIKNCDLLFVCNGDGYIGEQTRRDIYGATLLSKPIAYWRNPVDISIDKDELNYATQIPHDIFGALLDQFLPEQNGAKKSIKGCIIGSFRKHYDGITNAIDCFDKAGIEILSPKKSTIINPEASFVRLATDGKNDTDYEIQAKVFEHESNSDFVYVWNPEGYIGRTTCYEIGRIIERGTPIFYKEIPLDLPLKVSNDNILHLEDISVEEIIKRLENK